MAEGEIKLLYFQMLLLYLDRLFSRLELKQEMRERTESTTPLIRVENAWSASRKKEKKKFGTTTVSIFATDLPTR